MADVTFTVNVSGLDPAGKIKEMGFFPGGKAQLFTASEIIRHADKYVPFSSGILGASARIEDGGAAISYNTPYAHYLYTGKLYVDPITGKGAFHDPISGRFWSRPKTPKVATEKDLSFVGAPLRGARWVERMWVDESGEIIQAVQKFL